MYAGEVSVRLSEHKEKLTDQSHLSIITVIGITFLLLA
jgi:hypothetical protein